MVRFDRRSMPESKVAYQMSREAGREGFEETAQAAYDQPAHGPRSG